MSNLLNEFITRNSKRLREKKIAYIQEFFKPGNLILDVGVLCRIPETNASDNWLEKQHGKEVHIVAVGLEDMQKFRQAYPYTLCIQADGRALPFKTSSFTVVFSNAVLEHVPVADQLRFVDEMARVTQKSALLAVPDRLSPIEIHSHIFFLHWLPFWRRIFRLLGETDWASEARLSTIFTRSSLQKLIGMSLVVGQWKILRQTLFFLPASLIAIFEKDL